MNAREKVLHGEDIQDAADDLSRHSLPSILQCPGSEKRLVLSSAAYLMLDALGVSARDVVKAVSQERLPPGEVMLRDLSLPCAVTARCLVDSSLVAVWLLGESTDPILQLTLPWEDSKYLGSTCFTGLEQEPIRAPCSPP